MYIAGFVIPVPEKDRDAYRRWAETSGALFREHGCLEIVEAWEDDVPFDATRLIYGCFSPIHTTGRGSKDRPLSGVHRAPIRVVSRRGRFPAAKQAAISGHRDACRTG